MTLPSAWGLSYQEVMGLTWLAYKGNGATGAWSVDGNRWSLRSVHEHDSFRAVVLVGRHNVLSLSGTDDAGDWVDNVSQGAVGVSPQYLRALRLARSSGAEIVVGHSLGGGMASYCAIYGWRPAATINPAPLNLNLISAGAILTHQSLVINYIAPGEILQILDVAAANMSVIGRTYNAPSNGGWNPVDRHSIGNLQGFSTPTRA